MKKSRVLSLKKATGGIFRFFAAITEDKVTVFAAQASYFVIISSIPFLILVLGLAKYFVDMDWLVNLVESRISGNLGALINTVIDEVVTKVNAPLISVTVITTLWTSSRGVNSVTRGIGEIYGIRFSENFLLDIIRSIVYTMLFVVIIVASIIALMFADTIRGAVGDSFPLFTLIFKLISDSSKIVFTVVLTLFFALLFNTAAKKGKRFAKEQYIDLSEKLPRGFAAQLPGAAFAAIGWVLFSYFYSLYLAYFPTGYYLYGSLAAALLLMLWLYTCMNILLVGAEINKFIFKKREARRKTAEITE